jgi:hypothetical protein
MRIPKLPFHNVMAELLYSLFFQGECLAYVSLEVSDAFALSLNVPEHARYAVLVVECNTSQFNKDLVVRFREDNIAPEADNGMPLGDLGVYEIKGTSNMARFALIGVEAGLVHKVRIQFFG